MKYWLLWCKKCPKSVQRKIFPLHFWNLHHLVRNILQAVSFLIFFSILTLKLSGTRWKECFWLVAVLCTSFTAVYKHKTFFDRCLDFRKLVFFISLVFSRGGIILAYFCTVWKVEWPTWSKRPVFYVISFENLRQVWQLRDAVSVIIEDSI